MKEPDTSRQGQLVIIRAYGDRAIVRRVWDEMPAVVYIHDEENYDKHMRGVRCKEPVGFPRSDVYAYDKVALESYDDAALWSCLRPFVRAGREGE